MFDVHRGQNQFQKHLKLGSMGAQKKGVHRGRKDSGSIGAKYNWGLGVHRGRQGLESGEEEEEGGGGGGEGSGGGGHLRQNLETPNLTGEEKYPKSFLGPLRP